MFYRPPFLIDLLNICECIALICGIIKFKSLKNSYWKWFVFYLFYILTYEIFTKTYEFTFENEIRFFLSTVQIPIETLIVYWLIGYKSLDKKKLFWTVSGLYLMSFAFENYTKDWSQYSFLSLSQTFGTFLMLILIGFEFLRQIKSDAILNFSSDKMFYVTIGVVLFYIGNMPFFGWYNLILKYPEIWNSYYIYFMLSNCLMYLFFAASFIWGKAK